MLLAAVLLVAAVSGNAQQRPDPVLLAVFPEHVLVESRGERFALRVGAEPEHGLRVLATDARGQQAWLEVDGVPRLLDRSSGTVAGEPSVAGEHVSVRVLPDASGHFTLAGALNQHAVTFLLEPSLEALVLGAAEADRLGIDYRGGALQVLQTPMGTRFGHRVTLHRIRVAGIERFGVDAVVLPGDASRMLRLGGTALPGLRMHRDGVALILEAAR